MKGIIARSLGLSFVLAATTVTLTAGESPNAAPKAKSAGVPQITDWSHQHMIFSRPRTPEQAAALQNDVRYRQQLIRHTVRPVLSTKVDPATWRRFQRARRRLGRRMHRDWSYDLGPGATSGEARFPAKYSFSSSVTNCGVAAQPDFIVYGTSVAPSVTQGSIVALTNLYSGCPTGPHPAQYWSYDTGGTVLTSPVLSLDGTQLAFTQTTGGTASLVVLKYLKFDGFINLPTPLTPTPASSYLGCTAPCMTTLPLFANDTNSSVYYDYGSDTAFVGDDAGIIHQFSGVFMGTPTEVTTGGWPVDTVNGNILTSAVHDPSSGNTFVGDSGGFLYRVDGTGALFTSGQIDFGTGLTEGPIVDAGIGRLYAFSSDDNAGNAAVIQLSTGFATNDTGSKAIVGAATISATPLYNGAFDHNYIFSANSSGNLFVCGNPGSNPTLYEVPISAGVMGLPVAGPALSSTTSTKCSPVTDVYNPNVTGGGLPEEWAFASVQGAGTPLACQTVSCVMNFRTTSWLANNAYNAGQLILDSNMNIQVADNSGQTSGVMPPAWNTTLFGPTVDGGVHWRNQGPLISNPANPNWTATHLYNGGFEIIDTHNNIEIAELGGGTSGAIQPIWPTAEGSETFDGTVVWYNLGANPVAGLPANGGSSGIVIDNTAVLDGASQVYYTNLQDTGCFTSGGNGGCAIQASQQGLN